jgi:hypothetical protein
MTENPAKSEKTTAQPQAGKAQPPAQPAQPAESAKPAAGVFGDGSTQEEQDRLVKEAEEANAAVKEAANAEREARSQ